MSSAFRLSLAANVVLLAIVAVLLWRDRPAAAPPMSSVAPVPAARPPKMGEVGPEVAPEPASRSVGEKLTPTAMAQLEQMGIAREVIVNALLGEFHRRWDQRFAELEKKYAPKQVPEREYVELARLRDDAQVRELKEALGETGYLAWDKEQTLRMVNPAGLDMTPEESEQAYRLQKAFDEQQKELQMAMEDGVADMADAGALHTEAQQTLDRELEKLLGKARRDAMRGMPDPIADVYRMFGDLNPTPDQAKAALAVEEDYRAREADLNRRLQENPGDAATVAAELQAIQEAREENLRRTFGGEAYDAMKRQNDPTYKKLTQFAATWELNEHEVHSAYETLRGFHDEADRIRSAAAMSEAAGQRVDWREINSAIEQVRQQTEAGLQNLIGGKRLWRLKQNGLLTGR